MSRTTPSDRRLNHRRYAATERAQRIIETAATDLIAFEQRHGLRKRHRREADLRALGATIDAILSDLMHHHAIGGRGDLRVSRSKRMHEGGSRYRASISTKALPDILDRLASPELALIVRIPIQTGRVFRFEVGHHSGMKPASIPINNRPPSGV